MENTIYSYTITQENAYQTNRVAVAENYDWNMKDHINKSVLYKNSKFSEGANDGNRPFKNITRPILNLQYRAEGFDVKDIILFINDAYQYFKSFLVKKFHEKWARENDIDTFIDEMVESYVDFGGALVKDINEIRPEVVPLQRIAFCDQTDILSGPIAEKHNFAPDQLREMVKNKWDKDEIENAIILSSEVKKNKDGTETRTPGKYIEVYEIHGIFPTYYLDGKDVPIREDEVEFVRQLHIVCFYKDKKGDKQGITLYKGKEKELPYKFLARDAIYNRALGMGGAEELFEPQVWTNLDQIRMERMLQGASKVILQTTDNSFKGKNKLNNLDTNEVLVTETNTRIEPINTQPYSVNIFNDAVDRWEAHARQMGAANESIMGESPASGTPFKLQELITAESHSLHEYRKGKLATFLGEIYRDWIIPHIVKEITKGQKFLATLDLDEMQTIAEQLVNCATNNMVKERILNGQLIYPEEIELFKSQVKDQFMKKGNKQFIEILKGELKDAPMEIEVNIAGKQKNLSAITDKLVNVFRQIVATPQVLDDPRMGKLFNTILENSGLSPIDFYQAPKPQIQQPQQMSNQQMVAQNQAPSINQMVGATA